ncbi:MAG: hypothetical protein JXA44_07540 [Methanospirillaceae archaeon]|nr:hypothetical protein [Methanospirillaceae archaeon]
MDQKIRERAIQAVSDIFRAAGYTVNNADPPLSLSAYLGDDVVLILCSDDPAEVSVFSKQQYQVMMKETEAKANKLVVTFSGTISAPGCNVWYPDDFARYAGQAVLSGILKRKLVIQSKNLSIQSWYENGNSTEGEKDTRRLAHLPVRISENEIHAEKDASARVVLLFVPYWFYQFTCKGEDVYAGKVVTFNESGTGACSSLTGRFIDVDPATIVLREIPEDATLLEPSVKKEDAQEFIRNHLLDNLSRDIRMKKVTGETITYEEKRIIPSSEWVHLEIQPLYLPVWQVKGKHVREIDAFSGQPVEEPIDDGAEIF